LEARLDSVGGPLIASVTLPRTGGWDKFVSLTSSLGKDVTGMHDLYFRFNGQNITAGRELFNFDWWKFNQK
jgi:Carbohydrate binding module (family 6).